MLILFQKRKEKKAFLLINLKTVTPKRGIFSFFKKKHFKVSSLVSAAMEILATIAAEQSVNESDVESQTRRRRKRVKKRFLCILIIGCLLVSFFDIVFILINKLSEDEVNKMLNYRFLSYIKCAQI